MNRLPSSIFIAFLFAGCLGKHLLATGQPCPCAPGWTCDTTSNTCVNGAPAPASDDAASDVGSESCEELGTDYLSALNAARACTPGAPNQCEALVDPVLEPCNWHCRQLEPANAATQVNAALQRWAAQCAPACPQSNCTPLPPITGTCVATDGGNSAGICVLQGTEVGGQGGRDSTGGGGSTVDGGAAGGAGGTAGTAGGSTAGSTGTGGTVVSDCTGDNDGATIVTTTCAQAYCHDPIGASVTGGLDLTVNDTIASRLVGVISSGSASTNGSFCAGKVSEPYLVPGSHPAVGLLIDKTIDSYPCGSRMPLVGLFLTATQENCLIQWATTLTSP